jgi:hypothetical protein
MVIIYIVSTISFSRTIDLQCYSLLEHEDNSKLSKKFHITNRMQTSKIASWKPTVLFKQIGDRPYAEFSFTNVNKKIMIVRNRIQMNIYDLPPKIDRLTSSFEFSIDDGLDNFLKSNAQVQWLTLFEIWNDPGWKNKRYPFRISLNLHKDSEKNYLTPVVSGETKDNKTGEWIKEWDKRLNINILTTELYSLNTTINLSEDKIFTLKLQDKSNTAYFERRANLTHRKNKNDQNIWGLNPIKLYTSTSILELIKSKDASLSIKFYRPRLCLPS